ncbi:hypothetical protein [Mucilaginibacter antarcticus]|uniref:Uncharacterized protein n=1 Tax=Mucilaginibacter antarcticus TaxID=1855725 RepID=A0ABW5XPR1_9SPHI
MRKTIYVALNLIFQLVVFFCLMYANTYINNNAVPESLLWKGNQPRTDFHGMLDFAAIKTLLLIIEGSFFVGAVYLINRSTLNSQSMVKRTLTVHITLTTCFIAILIWGSFKGYLW